MHFIRAQIMRMYVWPGLLLLERCNSHRSKGRSNAMELSSAFLFACSLFCYFTGSSLVFVEIPSALRLGGTGRIVSCGIVSSLIKVFYSIQHMCA